MKKGERIELVVNEVVFPNKGIGMYDGYKVVVKNAILDEVIEARISKIKAKTAEAKIIRVIKKAEYEIEAKCCHFGICGGCSYQTIPYEKQLDIKLKQVKDILDEVIKDKYEMLPIVASENEFEYRNKMEFSFGDEVKDGPLALGMHEKNSFHSIVNTMDCCIVDGDFRSILKNTLSYFQENNTSYCHKLTKEGFLKYLIVRKAKKTGQILINLITSSQGMLDENEFSGMLLGIDLMGDIKCIAHSTFDGLGDVAKADEMKILYGEDKIVEELLGLRFNISSFSFFQTNTVGAERLYSVVREFVGETKDKVIFDLYSGTGTIAQILADKARKVIGIEIIKEAVCKANENAELNKLNNCVFIAGDVLTKIDELEDKPDIIVLDPPREGIHPKAIQKIIDYKPDKFIYISCKPSSLSKDLPVFFDNGYKVKKVRCVDLFAQTYHVEVVIMMTLSIS